MLVGAGTCGDANALEADGAGSAASNRCGTAPANRPAWINSRRLTRVEFSVTLSPPLVMSTTSYGERRDPGCYHRKQTGASAAPMPVVMTIASTYQTPQN